MPPGWSILTHLLALLCTCKPLLPTWGQFFKNNILELTPGLSMSQTKWIAFQKELSACFSDIRHFRFILEGRAFTSFTDHKPLTFLCYIWLH